MACTMPKKFDIGEKRFFELKKNGIKLFEDNRLRNRDGRCLECTLTRSTKRLYSWSEKTKISNYNSASAAEDLSASQAAAGA